MEIEKIKLENKGFEIDVIIKKINEIIYHVNCIDSFVEYPEYKVPEKENANSPLLGEVPFTIENRGGINILVYKDGGCRPASAEENLMYEILKKNFS